ncbi:helix-turn-helix domain-containing protein [Mycolicibacterium sarraceniae]|uniref:helix-turn-helix domain-containing protein n=1 Tax=Mycolicibacterium sarraceniae TaxID=1534348 RepID=UPI0015D3FEF5|nr:helix-turn-helix domain-containing protein [Mycolicibacterium sarraceniae]
MEVSCTTCSIDGCGKAPYARGMCCAHYKKFLKARSPGTARPRPAATEAEPALTARVSLPEFLAGLAAACPPLPGARCRDQVDLFDRTAAKDQAASTAALALCRACPAREACRAWFDNLPPDQRPIGVVAGQIVAEDKTTSGFQREKAERDKRIAELHAAGLTNSEIAAVTGCSKTTVLRALTGHR